MDQNSPQDITTKVQSNASVSYFFLSYLLLLSKKEAFAHPFVRAHAKYAAIFHTAILVLLGVMLTLFSTRGERKIRTLSFLEIDVSQIIFSLAFLLCFFGLMQGLYRASRKQYPSFVLFRSSLRLQKDNTSSQKFQGNLDETDAMIVMSSYVPYLGIFVSGFHSDKPEVIFGSRVGSLIMILIIVVGLFSQPGQYTVPLLLIMIYTIAVFFRAIVLFFQSEDREVALSFSIPSWTTVYASIRAMPRYLLMLLKAISGGKEKLDFGSLVLREQIADEKRTQLYKSTHTNDEFLFSPYMIYIPILNLIYIPRLFILKDNIYRLAVKQGIALSATWILLWGQDMSEWWSWLLLFPFFLGLSQISKNPTYRVIFAYELARIVEWVVRFFPTKKSMEKVKKSEEYHPKDEPRDLSEYTSKI